MHFPSFAAALLLFSSLVPTLAAPIPSASSLCKPKQRSSSGGAVNAKPDILTNIFPSPTAAASSSASKHHAPTPTTSSSHAAHSTASSASHAASASRSASVPASEPSSSSSSSSAPSSKGARFVIYTDSYIASGNGLPSPSDIKGYNVLALSFLLASGPADQAQQWTTLSASDRASALAAYHAAGIRVIVSAFGETESPTTKGEDPVDTANAMAAWVKKYGLDGIDVDYEDFDAFDAQPAKAIQWLETFTKTLRAALPAGQYTISHAPVAPWFTNDNYKGGYLAIDKSVGSLIDWYNVQFYNQGSGMYTDCTSLLTKAGSAFPGTSVFEIAAAGVPLNKLVIGKPATAADASNGFLSTGSLATCVAQAQEKGWNAGVMTWEFPSAKASWISAVRGSVFPL